MKKTILVLVAVFVLVGVFGGCGKKEEKPLAVATIPPLKCILTELLGEWVEVECIMPEGNSPFTFEPTEQDLAKLTNAKFVLTNGGELDNWITDHIGDIPSFNLLEAATERGLTEFDQENPFVYLDISAIRELSLVLAPILEEKIEGSFGVKSYAFYMESNLATLEENWQNRFRKMNGKSFIGMTHVWDDISKAARVGFAGATYVSPTQMPEKTDAEKFAEIIEKEKVKLVIIEPEYGAIIADEIADKHELRKVSISTMGGGEGTYLEYVDAILVRIYQGLE